MAEINIGTPANIKYTSGGTGLLTRNFNAGATITVGQAVALDAVGGEWQLADANVSETLAGLWGYGIALNNALDDQPLTVLTGSGGILNFGAVLAVGEVYVISADVAGGIADHADVANGWFTTILGYAQTTSEFVFQPLRVPFAAP